MSKAELLPAYLLLSFLILYSYKDILSTTENYHKNHHDLSECVE